ncbi:APC family permease [Piscirickettsia litoralis]|uniref:Amino acid permease n=1 Tax=Piscirickettsia litoralis TaxID=1891921 RepID=A0ABX3A2X4_9GAMM|nr:APC family permease [Piscirickettsia litoralis]ODN43227.1 amino acid permease [Piscirickettsia litoralis]
MRIKRSISPIALLFSSVSAILGSGWLFSAYFTSKLAGPSALLAWVIGGVTSIIIAFVFAELCTAFPVTGSSTRIPLLSHGTLVSFVFSWVIWLSYMALAPTEVQAVVQYLAFYFPSLTHTQGALTSTGYITATFLMLAISAINTYSLQWLIRANNALTYLKLIIPIIIALVILAYFHQPSHLIHKEAGGFAPFGMHGIFAAITSGGIVFAFTGFKQAAELAGEAKNPAKALPIAIIGSIVICLIIFLLLQTAFLTSMNSHNLAGGWHRLDLSGAMSPLSATLQQDHLTSLLPLLYIGALAGPLASGLMYCSSSSRSLFGMSKNGYLPVALQRITTQGNPITAIMVNFVVGMLMFAPLPGWEKMVGFLSSLMSLTYAIAPIALLALRQQMPDIKRPFKLPLTPLWAWLAFYIATLMSYWSGWETVSKISIALAIGLILFFGYHTFSNRGRSFKIDWKESTWLWPYFIGLTLISYLGNFGDGKHLLPFGLDFIIIGIFCAIIMALAMRFRLPDADTKHYVSTLVEAAG